MSLALNFGLAGACLAFIAIAYQATLPAPRVPSGRIIVPSVERPALATAQNDPALKPGTGRYGWRDVWSPGYPRYLDRLRQAGCPGDNIARLAIRDVDEFYARQLLEAAVVHDHEWWRSDVPEQTLPALQAFAEVVEVQRALLLSQLLGDAESRSWRRDIRFWQVVPLTGAVLGALAPETHLQVQEICRRQEESCKPSSEADPVGIARSGEVTRRELAAVLDREQLEEFRLRYSPSSSRLRGELAAVVPSAEEFRTLFAALDPVDQRVRLEYGDVSRLSPGQRAQHQLLRQEIIREVLSVERFGVYLRARGG